MAVVSSRSSSVGKTPGESGSCVSGRVPDPACEAGFRRGLAAGWTARDAAALVAGLFMSGVVISKGAL